jgi:peptidoglycan hydrolase-like protein with peptidoglycan-binding domain
MRSTLSLPLLVTALVVGTVSLSATVRANEDPCDAANELAEVSPLLSTLTLQDVVLDRRVLAFGDFDPSVGIVRSSLADLGYESGRGPNNDYFGANLWAAVRRYEFDNGFSVTGTVDSALLLDLVFATEALVEAPEPGPNDGEGASLEERILIPLMRLLEDKEAICGRLGSSKEPPPPDSKEGITVSD